MSSSIVLTAFETIACDIPNHHHVKITAVFIYTLIITTSRRVASVCADSALLNVYSNGDTNKIIIIIKTISQYTAAAAAAAAIQFQIDLYSTDTFECLHQQEKKTTASANTHKKLFQAVCAR